MTKPSGMPLYDTGYAKGYQKGDTISFTTIDSMNCYWKHPVEDETFEITYVLSDWGLEKGYVALAIRRVTNEH